MPDNEALEILLEIVRCGGSMLDLPDEVRPIWDRVYSNDALLQEFNHRCVLIMDAECIVLDWRCNPQATDTW